MRLSGHCTLEVGGEAELATVTTVPELRELAREAREAGRRLRPLGGGSNVVIADQGLEDLIVDLKLAGREEVVDGDQARLSLGAGLDWDAVVEWTVSRGWSGLECLSGIPGRVGATPIQNVGAYGREVGQVITRVHALDLQTLEEHVLPASKCNFSYRNSLFKGERAGRDIVTRVEMTLEVNGAPTLRHGPLAQLVEKRAGKSPTLADARAAVLETRRSKSMVWSPTDPNRRSCGSFFTNPFVSADQLLELQRTVDDPSMPSFTQADGRTKLAAAWLIERAGLTRGLREGFVGLSSAHTLQLVCHEGARAADVVSFAWRIRNTVQEKLGVRLTPEPVFWGFDQLDQGLPVL